MKSVNPQAYQAAKALVESGPIGGLSTSLEPPIGQWEPRLRNVVAAQTAVDDLSGAAESLRAKIDSLLQLAMSLAGTERRVRIAAENNDSATVQRGVQLLEEGGRLAALEFQELQATANSLAAAAAELDRRINELPV